MEYLERLKSFSFRKLENGWSVSIPIGLDAIEVAIEMLNQLNDENIKDYQSIYFPKDGLISNISDKKEFKKLKIRFLNRATSYIVTACNVNGIFERSFRIFCDVLREEEYAVHSRAKVDNIIKAQRDKLKDIYFYRNKVLAHTSFSAPRKDHATLQFNSLSYFSGQIMGLSSSGFGLGSGGWVFDNKEPEAPGFNLDEYHSFLCSCMDEWCENFVSLFDAIKENEIKGAFEKVTVADKIA